LTHTSTKQKILTLTAVTIEKPGGRKMLKLQAATPGGTFMGAALWAML